MYIYYVSNIFRMYLMIRQAHGVYVSFIFVKWVAETGYSGLKWVASFIPVPYKELGNKEGDFPCAENYYKNCISLPIYPTLTNKDQKMVINKIKQYYKE